MLGAAHWTCGLTGPRPPYPCKTGRGDQSHQAGSLPHLRIEHASTISRGIPWRDIHFLSVSIWFPFMPSCPLVREVWSPGMPSRIINQLVSSLPSPFYCFVNGSSVEVRMMDVFRVRERGVCHATQLPFPFEKLCGMTSTLYHDRVLVPLLYLSPRYTCQLTPWLSKPKFEEEHKELNAYRYLNPNTNH